jgi:hypothetical protein
MTLICWHADLGFALGHDLGHRNAIHDLIKQGKVAGSRVDFVRAGVGVAVKAGAPKLDIGSTEAFKHAMLAANSIAYSTGASGIIAARLMERLGIAEQLEGKIKLVDHVGIVRDQIRWRAGIDLLHQQRNLPCGQRAACSMAVKPLKFQTETLPDHRGS